MLLLLPPSETKRDGGPADAATLDLDLLSFPGLTPERRRAIAALRSLSRSVGASRAALRLGVTQRFEIERNRSIAVSPVLPAIERYTGVIFDRLEVGLMSEAERDFASAHVVIHSALFGLLGAADPIPAYRLSHDSRLPGLSLKTLWRDPIAAALADRDGLVLDLRSEGYADLGPAPATARYVRVVSERDDGRRVALSHANKTGKGTLVRALIAARIDHPSLDSLLAWTAATGIRLEPGAPGELDLLV